MEEKKPNSLPIRHRMLFVVLVPGFAALLGSEEGAYFAAILQRTAGVVDAKSVCAQTCNSLDYVQSLTDWLHLKLKGAPPTDLLVFDDMNQACPVLPSQLLMDRTVRLSNVFHAFSMLNDDRLLDSQWLPSPGSMREDSVFSDVFADMHHRYVQMSSILFKEIQPLMAQLCCVTGCSAKHALSGRRMCIYTSYVDARPKLFQALAVDPQKNVTIRGGLVLECMPGMHALQSEGCVVSVLDFSSAYPTIGATVLKDTAPAISDTFSTLLNLRRNIDLKQGPGTIPAKACKIFTNSIFYGCLSHKSGARSNPRLAAIITSNGRRALWAVAETLRDMAGVTVLAGHTDGILVKHPVGMGEQLLTEANRCDVCRELGLKMKVERTFGGRRFLVCDKVAYAGTLLADGSVYSKGLENTLVHPRVIKKVFRQYFLKPLLCNEPVHMGIPYLSKKCRKELTIALKSTQVADLVCLRLFDKCRSDPVTKPMCDAIARNQMVSKSLLVPFVCVAPRRAVWAFEFQRYCDGNQVDVLWYHSKFLDGLLARVMKGIRTGSSHPTAHRQMSQQLQAVLNRNPEGIHQIGKEDIMMDLGLAIIEENKKPH